MFRNWPAPIYRLRLATLFDAIAHGDQQHRDWLRQAISDHLAGRPVKQPVGGNSAKWRAVDKPPSSGYLMLPEDGSPLACHVGGQWYVLEVPPRPEGEPTRLVPRHENQTIVS